MTWQGSISQKLGEQQKWKKGIFYFFIFGLVTLVASETLIIQTPIQVASKNNPIGEGISISSGAKMQILETNGSNLKGKVIPSDGSGSIEVYTTTQEIKKAIQATQPVQQAFPNSTADSSATGEQTACNLNLYDPTLASSQPQPTRVLPSILAPGAIPGDKKDPTAVRLPGLPERGPSSPAQSDRLLTDISTAVVLANQALGLELIGQASQKRKAVQNFALQDSKVLGELYQGVSEMEIGSYLKRAFASLGESAHFLENATTELPLAEKLRFRNFYLNARDKAGLGLDILLKGQQDQETPGTLLFQPSQNFNPFTKTKAMTEVFEMGDVTSQISTTPDALVKRLIMFHGLIPDQQKKIVGKLKLVEKATLRLPGGKAQMLNILHNGYIFGGGTSGIDCSSFISSILPADVRKGHFTTLDFHSMWTYKKTRHLIEPPKYTPIRAEQIKSAADAFIPIDLEQGEKLTAGDLLIFRLVWSPIGHVFLVKSYNPMTMQAEVIEAAQSAGTIREREFSLTLDPPEEADKGVRPGFFALRLKPIHNRVCHYKNQERRPHHEEPF